MDLGNKKIEKNGMVKFSLTIVLSEYSLYTAPRVSYTGYYMRHNYCVGINVTAVIGNQLQSIII